MQVAVRQTLAQQLPHLTPKEIGQLTNAVATPTGQDAALASGIVLDPLKRDAFAVGMTAFSVGQGAHPFDFSEKRTLFDYKPDAVLSEVANRKLSADGITDKTLKTAVEDLIKLVDGLTNHDLDARIDIPTALKSAAFDLTGVGSPETRALIDGLLRREKGLGADYLPLPTQPPTATGRTTPLQRAQTI